MIVVALAIPFVQPLNSYVHFWPSLVRTMSEQKAALSAAPCEDPGQLPLYIAAEAVSATVSGTATQVSSEGNVGNGQQVDRARNRFDDVRCHR